MDFGRAIPAATSLGEDPETSSDAETLAAQQAERPADPDIRADADERGRVQNRERKPSGLQKFFNFLGGKDRKQKQRPSQAPRR